MELASFVALSGLVATAVNRYTPQIIRWHISDP